MESYIRYVANAQLLILRSVVQSAMRTLVSCDMVVANAFIIGAVCYPIYAGAVIAELKDGHSHGVACVAFSPKDDIIVSAGFKLDARIQVSATTNYFFVCEAACSICLKCMQLMQSVLLVVLWVHYRCGKSMLVLLRHKPVVQRYVICIMKYMIMHSYEHIDMQGCAC
jgi:hypothetical protein